MAIKKKVPATPKKKMKLTAAQIARRREQAQKQWAPDGKLRQRQREGVGNWKLKPPPRHAAALVERACAEFGATITAICEVLGCGRQTFYEWLKRHDDIRAAYERGREIEKERLMGILFRNATGGDNTAAIVLLKMRHHMRDSGPIPSEQEGTAEEKAAKIRAALKAMEEADGYTQK